MTTFSYYFMAGVDLYGGSQRANRAIGILVGICALLFVAGKISAGLNQRARFVQSDLESSVELTSEEAIVDGIAFP
jgi:hypothetical protein